MRFTLKAVNYKAISKNTLKGRVDLITPGGLRIKEVLWHESYGKEWVSMPAIPWESQEGKKQWRSIIEFETPEVKDAWQMAALDAIHSLLGNTAGRGDQAADGKGIL